jgi:hypothetical protein
VGRKPRPKGLVDDVAIAVADCGFSSQLAELIALGIVAKLHQRVWDRLDACLGTGDDVETLAGWKGKRGVLVSSLVAAGFLEWENGVLVAVRALQLAPEGVRKSWRRRAVASYQGLVARTPASQRLPTNLVAEEKVVDVLGFEGSLDVVELDLFGNPAKEPEPRKGKRNARDTTAGDGQPGHRAFVEWWDRRFTEEHGIKYPWQKRDFDHITRLLTLAGGYDQLCEWAERYFTCKENYFTGHPLAKLIGDVTRFAVSTGGAKREHGSQAGTSLSYDSLRDRVGPVAEEAGDGAME